MYGRSQERTIGAIIYAVSREVDTALTPALIADSVEADRSSIKQTHQKVSHELDLDIGPPVPSEFVAAINVELELPTDVERRTRQILGQQDTAGGNPIGIAAAAIYVTCEHSDVAVMLKDLAVVTGLTKETIWRQKSGFADDVRS
jgi:transcription initiation factor TFIIB